MKKTLLACLSILLLVSLLAGCGEQPAVTTNQTPVTSESSSTEATEATTPTEATTDGPVVPVFDDPVMAADYELTGIDFNNYEKLDWAPVNESYYNAYMKNCIGGVIVSNGKRDCPTTVASGKTFTSADLPAGTVVIIDEGWKYRLEVWKDAENVLDQSKEERPDETDAPFSVIDEGFWAKYAICAFNVRTIDEAPVAEKYEDASKALRIYVPKAVDTERKTLKVLAIGNSFSVDALEWLPEIAKAQGYKVVLGNLYIGGCTVSTHADSFKGNKAAYICYENRGSTWTPNTLVTTGYTKVSPNEVLQGEDWDIITLQQASGYSGMEDTYGENLTYMAARIKELCPNAKLYWHMTWAYQSNSNNSDFSKYGNDRTTMYNAIVKCVQNKVVTNSNFDGVIPVGTAVENVRNVLGDNITRDGYHLKKIEGRYLAALCWFCAFTGTDPNEIRYRNSYTVTGEMAAVYKTAVADALANMYEVTEQK